MSCFCFYCFADSCLTNSAIPPLKPLKDLSGGIWIRTKIKNVYSKCRDKMLSLFTYNKNGDDARSRTGVGAFAEPCLASWRRRPEMVGSGRIPTPFIKRHIIQYINVLRFCYTDNVKEQKLKNPASISRGGVLDYVLFMWILYVPAPSIHSVRYECNKAHALADAPQAVKLHRDDNDIKFFIIFPSSRIYREMRGMSIIIFQKYF